MAEQKLPQQVWSFRDAAVIVAHPDDETLWAGGTMLLHPETRWTVLTICRKSDRDRAPRFFQALEKYNTRGLMADLDDGPDQTPLDDNEVRNTILSLLPTHSFELIITHSPHGEYTRHRRHEETSKAVTELCKTRKLSAEQLWMFAYNDNGGKNLPQPAQNADIYIKLPEKIWQKKYDIITGVYGFNANSFEAKTTPRIEAFSFLELE